MLHVEGAGYGGRRGWRHKVKYYKTSVFPRTSQSVEKIGIYKYLLRHTLVSAKIEAQSAIEVKGGEISFNWKDLWKVWRRELPIGLVE